MQDHHLSSSFVGAFAGWALPIEDLATRALVGVVSGVGVWIVTKLLQAAYEALRGGQPRP